MNGVVQDAFFVLIKRQRHFLHNDITFPLRVLCNNDVEVRGGRGFEEKGKEPCCVEWDPKP